MSNIPTAEELILAASSMDHPESKGMIYKDIKDFMIEFAKLHVQAALKAAASDAETKDVPYTDDVEVDKDSILNSYPLENIK